MEFAFVWDSRQLNPLLDGGVTRALTRALRMAGGDAGNSLVTGSVKEVRAARRLKVKEVKRAIPLSKPPSGVRDLNDLVWTMRVSGAATRAIAFPNSVFGSKKGARGGVRFALKTGAARTTVQGAFIAKVGKGGHVGIFRRKGKGRLPIQEIFGPRVSDLIGKNAGMKDRILFHAQTVFGRSFDRLLPLELKKLDAA